MKPLTSLAARLDRLFRDQDFAWNRMSGGPLDRMFGVERHTIFGFLLAAVLIFFVWCGPVIAPGARLWFGLASLISVPILIGAARLTQSLGLALVWDLIAQLVVLAVSIGAVIVFGHPRPGPAGHLYQNVILVAAAVYGASALVSEAASRWALPSSLDFSRTFAPLLERCELFAAPKPLKDVTVSALGSGLRRLPFARAPHLLLPSAIAVLLAPGNVVDDVRYCVLLGGAVLALNIVFLLLGEVNQRLGSMITVGEALFFRGTSIFVSATVILVAVLRLADIDYVTTLLDSDETLHTILSFLIAGYAMSWWYDYWVSRFTSDRLLRHLGNRITPSSVAYPIDPAHAGAAMPPAANRSIALTGASRFVVVRHGDRPDERPVFQPFGTFQIFHRLEDVGGETCTQAVDTLFRRRVPYAYFVTILPVAVFALLGLWLHSSSQLAEREVQAGTSVATPRALLFGADQCVPGGRVIALAASGGGTRAALFTAGALEGLRERGLLQKVRLVSGVSGGGAALAYFASRRPRLLEDNAQAWDSYFKAMTAPFIADVLAGLGQWRVLHGTRLGSLLVESFDDRWANPDDAAHPPRQTFGEVSDVGVMWNASIAGRFSPPPGAAVDSASVMELERAHRGEPGWSTSASGRMVLTNLALELPLDRVDPKAVGPDKADFVVISDPKTPLTTAAALNANFPPVFSNAAVDLPGHTRYWVTDGGALDNSGLESLLYVLRQAIAGMDWSACASRPVIDVLTIDAGAYSDSYSQDRGISTALGAGTVFETRLASELADDLRRVYPEIRFHYLEMPRAIRRSGSFGTHWMLQPNITVTLENGKATTLRGEEIVGVVRALFSGDATRLKGTNGEAVYGATHADFDRVWRGFQ